MQIEPNSNQIVKSLGAGLTLIDKDFRVRWSNEVSVCWFGNKSQLYGHHCYEVMAKSKHICRGCPVNKVFLTGKTIKSVKAMPTTDGLKHYFQITASPISNNSHGVVRVVELIEDVTDQKKRQRKANSAFSKIRSMCRRLLSVNSRLNSQIGMMRTLNRKTSMLKNRFKCKYKEITGKITVMKEELDDLMKINSKIGSSGGNLKTIASMAARLACKIIHTKACVVRLIDPNSNMLVTKGAFGLNRGFLASDCLKLGEGLSGKVVTTLKPASICHDAKDKYKKGNGELENKELYSALAVPVLFQGKPLGAITTYTEDTEYRFAAEEIKLLSAFASEIGVAFHEAKLYEDVRRNYFSTIRALVLAMEARDPYTRGHADRVTRYAIQIAQQLNLNEKEIEILHYAGEVHDVGKIGISDRILNKPGRLTPYEKAAIQVHPVRGAEMLEPLKFLEQVIPLVRHHHEWYNGAGYPDGLKKENIPLMARIIACADAFDAMTSDRPYRSHKLSINDALREIKLNAGVQFDPEIAKLFIKIIQNQPYPKASS